MLLKKIPEEFEPEETSETNSKERIFVSPLAKKIALEKNIDLEDIIGSGDNGRIIKEDVENYSPKEVSSKVESTTVLSSMTTSLSESYDDVDNSQMRKAIARRLTESKFTAPHYYLSVEFEMDNAIALENNTIQFLKLKFHLMILL